MAVKKAKFEESMTRLEQIVAQMERGEAPLEETMSLFEEGTKLVSQCRKQLDDAEQKVWKLSKGLSGEPVEAPFEGEE